MTPTKQIEFLARAIVNRLEDRGLVEFTDAEAGIEIVTRILEENFRELEGISQEARDLFAKRMNRQPTDGELEEEMRRVASNRSVLL